MTARHDLPHNLTVYYDGGCSFCRQQVAFWRRLDKDGRIAWQDIGRDARALLGTGISHRHALHRVHARDRQGRRLQGARVMTAIMQEIPRLRLAGQFAALPPFIWLLEVLYRLALPLRRLFTGRWRNCCGEE